MSRTVKNKRVALLLASAAALTIGRSASATNGVIDTWTSSATNQNWLTAGDWSNGIPNAFDTAQFTTTAPGVAPGGGINLDFADGTIAVGAIENNLPATGLSFSASSGGTLTLNGATVTVPFNGSTETYANTILTDTDSASTSTKNLTFGTNINISLTQTSNTILTSPGSTPVVSIAGNVTDSSPTVHAGITFLGGGTGSVNGGQLTLSGTNTFSGGLTIGNTAGTQGGVVMLGSPASLPGTGAITVNEQGQLAFNGTVGTTTTWGTAGQTLILNGIGINKSSSGSIRVGGGSKTASVAITYLGNIQLGVSSTVLEPTYNGYVLTSITTGTTFKLTGNLTGGNFLEQGSGTFELAGSANTFGNTQIGNGGIIVDAGSSLGTGDVTLFQSSTNSPTITLNNTAQTIGSLTSLFTATASVPLNGNGYSQNLSLGGTTLTITEPASSTFGYGTVAALTSGLNDGTSPGKIVYNSTSGHTLTLTGPNSYSGGTIINAGTLSLANNVSGSSFGSALGTGSVSVNKGGILASSGFTATNTSTGLVGAGGTFTGPLIVNTGGIVSPGGSIPGSLTTGAITANAGSIFSFAVNSASAGNYSTLTSTGAITFATAGTETINITGSRLATGTFYLMTGSSIVGGGSNVVVGSVPTGSTRSYALSTIGNQEVLTVVNNGIERDYSTNGSSAVVDGPGTIAQGSTNFFQTPGTPNAVYNNSDNYDTAFGNGGNGGLITLGSNIRVGGTFILAPLAAGQSYTFGAAGGTNSLTTVGGIAVSNNTTIVAPLVLGGSQTVSVDGNITLTSTGGVSQSATSTLTKTGLGTLVLSGTGTYTGGTVVSQGTLQTGTSGLPSAGGVVNNGTLIFDQTTAGTYAGAISGSGGVTINNTAGTGSPSVTLSNAANSYTGTTTINGGTLAVGAVSQLGTGDGGIVLNGGTLRATGNLVFALNNGTGGAARSIALTAGSTSTIDTNGNSVTLNDNIAGAGNLNKIGTGTLTLGGIPSTTIIGAVTVAAGNLVIAPSGNPSFGFSAPVNGGGNTGVIEIAGAVSDLRLYGGIFSGGGSFQVDATPAVTQITSRGVTTIVNNIVLNPQNATGFSVNLGANTGNSLALSGVITGNGSVDFTGGAGNITLAGVNTYTGSTKVDNGAGGSVQLLINNPLPAATDLTVTSTGNLDLNGFNQTVNSLSATSATALIQNMQGTTNSTLTITGSTSTTYAGLLQDPTGGTTLGLTLNGSGALALSTPELYSGSTAILNGRLDITAINPNDSTTGLGATSDISIGSAANPTNAQLRFNGITGTVSYVTLNHPFGTTAPVITLNSMGGYTTGTTFDPGAIRVNASSALVLPDNIVFAANSAIAVSSTSTLNLTGTLSGTGTLFSEGGGVLTLSGTNTGYTGGTQVDAGTLTVAAGSALGTGSLTVNNAGLVASDVVLNLNNTTQTVGSLSGTITAPTPTTPPTTAVNTATINLGGALTVNQTTAGTYRGVIAGTGTFTKTGSATLTLAGTNTYTGNTTVSAGTLSLATTGSLATTKVTVASGATLDLAAPTTGGILVRTLTGNLIDNGSVVVDSAAVHANRQLIVASNLILGSGAKFDLGNNDLDLPGASLAAVTALVKSGYNLAGGANFAGAGIDSSAAAGNTAHNTALGVAQNITTSFDGTTPASTDVLVKYTYFGDANLDGKVDGSDYSLIDNSFNKEVATPGLKISGWQNGDFNYDGTVDGSDYTLIDNAFNTQTANLNSATGGGLFAGATDQIAGTAAVPEPATLGLLALLAAPLLGSRRRK